jgi:hypothetical protein
LVLSLPFGTWAPKPSAIGAMCDHQQEAQSTHDHGRGDGDEVGQQDGGEQQFDK